MQFKTPSPRRGALDGLSAHPGPGDAERTAAAAGAGGAGRRVRHVAPRGTRWLCSCGREYHAAVLTYSVGEGARNYQPLRQLSAALALLRNMRRRGASCRNRSQSAAFRRVGIWPCPELCWTCPAVRRRPSSGPMRCCWLTRGHGGRARPPGQLCPAGLQQDPATTRNSRWKIRSQRTPRPVFVWHDGGRHRSVENTLLLLAALREPRPLRSASVRKGRPHLHRRGRCCQRPPRPLGAAGCGVAERHLRFSSGTKWFCVCLQKFHEK